jgi:hypothetical protein
MSTGKSESLGAVKRAELAPPTNFVRVAKSGFAWELPRSFVRYSVDTNFQGMLGNATKWIIRTGDPKDPQFMVKYPQKFGEQETFTEFFINQLGKTLGFEMAHSGLVRADGLLVFTTRIFTSSEETLRHGSLIIEDFFKEEKALDRVRRKEEQVFYSIDFVIALIRHFVGDDFDHVLPKFIKMLVFDAILGSMDRHAQNWGVLETVTKPARYRFAPIFDSARAVLWSMDEARIEELSRDTRAFDAHLRRARPCLGPKRHRPGDRHCNHFDFIANLLELHPELTERAIQEVPPNVRQRSLQLLHRFPFRTAFSNNRKQLIVKILDERARMLKNILAKGGTQ